MSVEQRSCSVYAEKVESGIVDTVVRALLVVDDGEELEDVLYLFTPSSEGGTRTCRAGASINRYFLTKVEGYNKSRGYISE